MKKRKGRERRIAAKPDPLSRKQRESVGQTSKATDIPVNGRNNVILSGNRLQVNIGSISPNHIVKWQGIVLFVTMTWMASPVGGEVLNVLFGAWLLKELLPEFFKS